MEKEGTTLLYSILTSHRSYKTYMNTGKVKNVGCRYCGGRERGTLKRTVFHCITGEAGEIVTFQQLEGKPIVWSIMVGGRREYIVAWTLTYWLSVQKEIEYTECYRQKRRKHYQELEARWKAEEQWWRLYKRPQRVDRGSMSQMVDNSISHRAYEWP